MTTTAVEADTQEPTWFGHPRGLTWLFSTEMAERFSYYGMAAILLYYMTEQLFRPGTVETVLGYGAVKGALESFLGPLTPDKLAADLYGFYTGLVYLTPVFGGWIADRFWGQRYTVILGGVMMAAGEFVLTQNSLFFIGLLLLIIGNGFFKPNISTQVGNLYKPGDSRVDRAYSIFYVGINIGATLAPLICGTLGEEVGWHWGFFAAGVGLSLGVAVYLFALRTLPPDRLTKARAENQPVKREKLTRQDWKAIFALVALVVPTALFWMAYQQQPITIALWARDYTDRTFVPGVLNTTIPATWAQMINPIMIFAFTPIVVWLWGRQARRHQEPSTVIKMAMGCAFQAISFVLMAGVAALTGTHGHAFWLWLLPFFTIYTFGELYVSPIGLALVARVAPKQVLSLMMGFWFIAVFIGNSFAGFVGSFWDQMPKSTFFLMVAVIPTVAALIIWLFDKPLRPILENRPGTPLTPGEDLATERGLA
ncbi:MAG TPA: peptide MFS transporter [Rhizomicrobium sp.]|jgi:POT family proton-dependent oligopeptide transporter